MMRSNFRLAVVGALCTVLLAPAGYAWGPKAQQAITLTGLQLLRQRQPNMLDPEDFKYESDLARGAAAGVASLEPLVPVTSDGLVMEAIDAQIQLLRGAKKYGMGSYFAYRLGILSQLMAGAMLPYSFDVSVATETLRTAMENDIDARVNGYSFLPAPGSLAVIRSASDYYANKRPFFADNTKMIANDYRTGAGYKGFLDQGAEVLFGRSIEAVADALYTVMINRPLREDIEPSPQNLTWYFVDEIRYLLYERKNFYQATNTYQDFEKVNPGLMEAYDQLGDLFYEFGTEQGTEWGVRMWKIAQRSPGPQRQRAAAKLTKFYLREGDRYLQQGNQPGAPESDLQNALKNYSLALEFDSTNEQAASQINQTNAAIISRRKRYETASELLNTAATIVKMAEQSRMIEDFGSALATYDKAAISYNSVVDSPEYQFPDLLEIAHNGIKDIKKSVRDVLKQVLDNAQTAVDSGDQAVDSREYQRGIDSYEMVPVILQVIPDDDTPQAREKQELVKSAQERIEKAKREKTEWEALQAQQAAQQAQQER